MLVAGRARVNRVAFPCDTRALRWYRADMPVESILLAKGAGILFRCQDRLSGDELNGANAKVLAQPDLMRGLHFGIVDMSEVRSADIDTSHVHETAVQDELMARTMPKGFLVAVIASDSLAFGMARMWQAMAEKTGWETLVVRTRPEADRWLQKRLKEKFGIEVDLSAAVAGSPL